MGEMTGWLADPVTKGNGMPRVVPPFAGIRIWEGLKMVGRWVADTLPNHWARFANLAGRKRAAKNLLNEPPFDTL